MFVYMYTFGRYDITEIDFINAIFLLDINHCLPQHSPAHSTIRFPVVSFFLTSYLTVAVSYPHRTYFMLHSTHIITRAYKTHFSETQVSVLLYEAINVSTTKMLWKKCKV